MFLGENLHCLEESCEPGTLQFVLLLFVVTLCDDDKAMALRKNAQSFGYAREKFHLLFGDGVHETDNPVVLFLSQGRKSQVFKTLDKGPPKALEAVTVFLNRLPFDGVQVFADFVGSVNAVIQIGDEGTDRTFEVDVVFPQGIVGVEEQRLTGKIHRHSLRVDWYEVKDWRIGCAPAVV